MPSDANKPRFAFPYRRVPCLWHTPVSGFPHTIPASFVCEVCCFTEPEDAAVDLFLTEMRAHGNRGALNSGMMAKKAGEVNMAEGQICWPPGQGVSVQRDGRNTTVLRRLVSGDRCRAVSRRRLRCVGIRPIRPVRGGPGPGRTPELRAPAPGKDWWLGAEIRCGDPV